MKILLKIFIGLLVVVVVLPVALIFGFIYCTDTKEVNVQEISEISEMISNIVGRSLDGEKLNENDKIEISITEEDLDTGLMYLCGSLGESAGISNYIPKMYCEISGNKYDFFVDLQYSISSFAFKTRAALKTVLESTETEILHFKINSICLGRLTIPSNLIGTILSNFVSEEDINNTLKETGLNLNFSLSNLELTYLKEDFINDLMQKIGNDDNPLFSSLFGILKNDNYGILEIGFDDKISASINFVNDKVNLKEDEDNPRTKKMNHFLDTSLMNSIAGEIATMADNYGDIVTSDNATTIFKYLFCGAQATADEDMEVIQSINSQTNNTIEDIVNDLSSTATEISEYKGAFVGNDMQGTARYFQDVTSSNFDFALNDLSFTEANWGKEQDILEIKDEDLCKFFTGMGGFIGTGKVFLSKRNNGTTKADYIAVDNLFVDFQNKYLQPTDPESTNLMNIYMSAVIDGYSLTITIPTKIEYEANTSNFNETPSKMGRIKFNILSDYIEIGSLKINEVGDGIIDTLMSKLGDSFNTGEESSIKFSDESFYIDIDTPNKTGIPGQGSFDMGVVYNSIKLKSIDGDIDQGKKYISNSKMVLSMKVPSPTPTI